MTEKQKAIKARKFRLLASQLYVETHNDKLPDNVRDYVRTAHDAMCEAFNAMERA